jgi:hypothetical protein
MEANDLLVAEIPPRLVALGAQPFDLGGGLAVHQFDASVIVQDGTKPRHDVIALH